MTTTAFTAIRGASLPDFTALGRLNGEAGQVMLVVAYDATAGVPGGWFRWDETSTSGDDGGVTVLVPTNPRGRWVRVRLAGADFIMQSPNGHFWLVTIDNAGVLTTADLGTSVPNFA